MKKEIMDALKAKFEGVSDAILGRIADKLAKTAVTAEQVKTAVDAYTTQQLLEAYGDSRATEATQTAVQGYEKKYGLKEGKPVEGAGGGGKPNEPTPPRDEAGGGNDTPEWAKEMIRHNKELEERLNKMDADRTTASRRKQLSEVIEKLPESLRKGYERTSVSELKQEEFDSLLAEITAEVDGIVKDTMQRGAIFGRPASPTAQGQSGGGKEASKEEAAAVVARMGL